MGTVKFPFGPAESLAPAHTATHNITIENMRTHIKLSPTAAITINLSAGANLEVGAEVLIDVVQDGTGRNVTLGTGIVAPDLTGVANDRDTIRLEWNGTEFIGGAWAKVVDAG